MLRRLQGRSLFCTAMMHNARKTADMGRKIEQNGMFCLALGAVLCYA
jgi:hypothetical protein